MPSRGRLTIRARALEKRKTEETVASLNGNKTEKNRPTRYPEVPDWRGSEYRSNDPVALQDGAGYLLENCMIGLLLY